MFRKFIMNYHLGLKLGFIGLEYKYNKPYM